MACANCSELPVVIAKDVFDREHSACAASSFKEQPTLRFASLRLKNERISVAKPGVQLRGDLSRTIGADSHKRTSINHTSLNLQLNNNHRTDSEHWKRERQDRPHGLSCAIWARHSGGWGVYSTSIDIPDNISEESGITALVKSEAFKLIFNNGVYPTITSQDAKSSSPYYLAKRAQLLPLPRTTSGVVKKNYIEIDIAPNNNNAGSTTDHIRMWFGPSKVLKLKGTFTQGAALHWNLNEGKYYLETIDNDLWDDIILENPSGDGIKLKRIKIVHNSVVILNWQNANIWIDHSKLESHSHLGLASKILETKLAKVDAQYNWITQIHYAFRELGKSDGIKYNAEPGEPWCSEFASWCLRKALWKTPSVWVPNGILDIEEMENYFATLGRLVPKADLVKQNPFILKAGDYLSFQWRDGGTHSALFVAYKNGPPVPGAANDDTEIITVEGNTAGRVNVRKSRTLRWVRNAGNTQ